MTQPASAASLYHHNLTFNCIKTAQHRYCRGHGLKSRTGLNFFRPYFHYSSSAVHYCEDRFHIHGIKTVQMKWNYKVSSPPWEFLEKTPSDKVSDGDCFLIKDQYTTICSLTDKPKVDTEFSPYYSPSWFKHLTTTTKSMISELVEWVSLLNTTV